MHKAMTELHSYRDFQDTSEKRVFLSSSHFSLPHLNSPDELFSRNPFIQCAAIKVNSKHDIAIAKFRFTTIHNDNNINNMTNFALNWLDKPYTNKFPDIDTLSIGSSLGPTFETIESSRKSKPFPRDIYKSFQYSVLTEISHRYHKTLQPMYASSGCTAGLEAVGLLYDRIKLGRCRKGLALSIDYPIHDDFIKAYSRLGMLKKFSSNNCHTPWNKNDEGMILSEGISGLLLSEKHESSMHTCEVIGWDLLTDGYHPFHINTSPETISLVMKGAINSIDALPDTILVMAHANALYTEDIIELEAIQYFAKSMNVNNVIVATVKNSTAHPLAAAGPIQMQAASMALLNPNLLKVITRFVIVKGEVCPYNYNDRLPEPQLAIINARSFGSIYSSLSIGLSNNLRQQDDN